MERYYCLKFTVAACHIDIRVNDMPVFDMEVSTYISTLIPINIGIFSSGIQELKCTLTPLQGNLKMHHEIYFEATVEMYDVKTGLFNLLEENIVGFSLNEKDKELPLIIYKEKFDGQVDYEWTEYQNLIDLTKIKEENIRQMLDNEFKNLIEIIQSKDYDAFIKALANREKFMALCMYLDEHSSKMRLQNIIDKIEDDFKVLPYESSSIIKFYGYGRFVSLKNLKGESVLKLYNEEDDELLMLDLWFHLADNTSNLKI